MKNQDTVHLKADLPEDVAAVAAEHIGPAADIRIAVAGDMLPDGSFGDTWFVMNETRLGVIGAADGASPELLAIHELKDIDEFAVVSGISAAVVELSRHGVKTRLLRVSNTRQKDFAQATRLINAWIKDKEWKPELLDAKRDICARFSVSSHRTSALSLICSF